MTKIFIILTTIFAYFIVHGAEDIKYASSQDIEKMQLQAAQYLTPLMEAVIDKDIDKITALVKQEDLAINAQDNTGQTALMWAITHELPLDIIKLLLSVKNIDLNIKDNEGLTALDHGIIAGNEEIVEAILNSCELKDGICPLVNQRDTKLQLTPLARAAMANYSKIIKLLLQASANPTAVVTRGDKNIPVSELIKVDDKEITDLLKEKAKKFTARAREFIDHLIEKEFDKAKQLFELGINVNADKYGYTMLETAAQEGNKDFVKMLIDNKADVNSISKSGLTPLKQAVWFKHKDIVELLINNKADVNAKDKDGNTALHFAGRTNKDIVELLINHKADVGAKNKFGYTPIQDAALYGSADIVELLIKAGANVNAQDDLGSSPLGIAAQRNAKDIAELLIKNKADVNIKIPYGLTPLHYAASRGHKDIVKLLIESKADINAKNYGDETPLHTAIMNRQNDLVPLLIDNGAKINAKDHEGESPLHLAVRKRQKDIVKLLIENKVDINVKNKNGETPLDLAISSIDIDSVKIADMLKKAGAQ